MGKDWMDTATLGLIGEIAARWTLNIHYRIKPSPLWEVSVGAGKPCKAASLYEALALVRKREIEPAEIVEYRRLRSIYGNRLDDLYD